MDQDVPGGQHRVLAGQVQRASQPVLPAGKLDERIENCEEAFSVGAIHQHIGTRLQIKYNSLLTLVIKKSLQFIACRSR